MRPSGMLRWCPLLWTLIGAWPGGVAAQSTVDSTVVSVVGHGPTTIVLLSGIVGGVPGFRRLRAQLVEQGHRVIVIDPYRLSIDSVDVTFVALARRVDRILDEYGIDTARVVGHAHGGGVALRLAAYHPRRVATVYFLDVGALAANRTKLLSASLRLVPFVIRVPGGRRFIRSRLLHGLRQNAGRHEWLDPTTQRAYSDPLLDHPAEAVAMANRLARSREPETAEAVVARVGVPVMLLLGEVPHPSSPDPEEVTLLIPLGALVCAVDLPGVGHFPHEEAPALVAEHIGRGMAWVLDPERYGCAPDRQPRIGVRPRDMN